MQQFKVIFNRYNGKSGTSRFSAPSFISAEDFRDATARAALMRSAMAETDLSCDYRIAAIETIGLRGDNCVVGWETQEEFSARVDEKVKA